MAAHAIDVGETDFQTQVLDKSHEVPVLVDFWAAWCGPCRTLGPTLERLASEYGGAFILAKVDTDANQPLAQRYGIRGIPNCKLFKAGAVADEFVGAQPERAVRDFLDRHLPNEADALVTQAREAIATGHFDDALALLEQALADRPTHDAARDLRDHVRDATAFTQRCNEAGGEPALRARLETDPTDLDARLDLAACLAAAGRFRESLDHYLRAVEQNKRHRDEEARKSMLTIFALVGTRSELADEYRNKLMILL